MKAKVITQNFSVLSAELVAAKSELKAMSEQFNTVLDRKPSEKTNWRKDEVLIKTLATPLAAQRAKVEKLIDLVELHPENPENIRLAKEAQAELEAKRRVEAAKRAAERPTYKIGAFNKFKDGYYEVIKLNNEGQPSWRKVKDVDVLAQLELLNSNK